MGESNQKEKAEIQEDGANLVVDGRKYSPFLHMIWFTALDFRVGHSLDQKSGERFSTAIHGNVSIEGKGIEVIGAGATLSKTLSLVIGAEPPDHVAEYSAALAKEVGTSGPRLFHMDIPSRVSLGFMAGDWEINTKDEYYVQIGMCQSAFDQLLAMVDQGRLEFFSFGARFWGLYSDSEYAPISFPRRFALKKAGHSSAHARGELTSFNLHGAAVKIVKGAARFVDEADPGGSEEAIAGRANPGEGAAAAQAHLVRLTGVAVQMAATMRWTALALAGVLAVLVFKHW